MIGIRLLRDASFGARRHHSCADDGPTTATVRRAHRSRRCLPCSRCDRRLIAPGFQIGRDYQALGTPDGHGRLLCVGDNLGTTLLLRCCHLPIVLHEGPRRRGTMGLSGARRDECCYGLMVRERLATSRGPVPTRATSARSSSNSLHSSITVSRGSGTDCPGGTIVAERCNATRSPVDTMAAL